MFTGIIEQKGRISRIVKGRIRKVYIQSNLSIKSGDSIAVQGICLTVIDTFKDGFLVEAMEQTGKRTTLSQWSVGDYVNLERAMEIGGRIGGHIILGHIDEVGKLIRTKGNEYYFQIQSQNRKYLIPRGSIAIDGVSLTIGNSSGNIFSVFLIPYTLNNTTLGGLRVGSFVNIEYDYLVKAIKSR
ncbi:MAG: riboflavin synthase [candidate division WOR-3 bacterium]